jgi:hypothetical protein
VPRDRDVVVVDQYLDVQALGDREPRGFGIVALHLAPVGAEQNDSLARIGHRHTIAEGPHVAEPAGAELKARCQPLLRVARQPTGVFPIVEQSLRRHRSVEHAQQILRCDPMPGLVVDDGHDRGAIGDERPNDHHLRNGVVGAAGVPR